MTEVRRLTETERGYAPEIWQQMAEQLGLQSLAIPEEYGGAGFGLVDLTVVLQEMGVRCCPRRTLRVSCSPRTHC